MRSARKPIVRVISALSPTIWSGSCLPLSLDLEGNPPVGAPVGVSGQPPPEIRTEVAPEEPHVAQLGPLPHVAGTVLKSKGRSQTVKFFVADISTENLDAMRELIEAGQVKPVVERTYPLSQAAEALAYLGEGHARGKIVITV